jgi:GntP family gluconate:H+ symporter
MSSFLVLGIGVAFIIAAIAGFKLHPFFALLSAAVLVGLLSPSPEERERRRAAATAPAAEANPAPAPGPEPEAPKPSPAVPRASATLSATAAAFGEMVGKIGIAIALAAVIGQCLMESGAADKITRRLLAILGEKRAHVALLASGFILSVPVFFDTVFFLLVPLARALYSRTGRNYVLYVLAVCAGGAVTHSIVPPTPGPLVMVEKLELDLGAAIAIGILLGLPVSLFGCLAVGKLCNRRLEVPLRDVAGSSREELAAIVTRPERELPGFVPSLLPVALPVLLITAHSVVDALRKSALSADPEAVGAYAGLFGLTSFLGDKNFALFAGMVIALWVLARARGYSLARLMEAIEPALNAAGVIILITAAGGAFGEMLKQSGIGDDIEGFTRANQTGALWLIPIAWGVAAVMKVAQGSGTVAMVTGASIMAPILQGMTLPFHKIYIYAAIAYGSLFISWMNDSGFWVVGKMSGFTQEETLKTWTVLLGAMALFGLAEVLVLGMLLPGV